MNYVEVFWNNIASLVLIPTVIFIVLKLKNVQIDSLREENNVLKEQVKLLGLFRISEVEKEFEAMEKFYERRKREAEEAKKKLFKMTKELENVKSLNKRDAGLIVELFKKAVSYMGFAPTPMGRDYISQILYMMDGPIGELWREYADGGELWQKMKEYERKQKERGKSSSST